MPVYQIKYLASRLFKLHAVSPKACAAAGDVPERTAVGRAAPAADKGAGTTTRSDYSYAGSLRRAGISVAVPQLDNRKLSSYSPAIPRRKPGTLLPLETEILEAALSILRSGQPTFHGFALAQSIRAESGSRSLTAHGTLYKALGRLEEFGLLTSQWEDGAAAEGRPRRRLYELTKQGAEVAEQARAEKAEPGVGRPPRIVPGPA